MRQGMLTLSGAPSTTSHIGYIICPFLDYYILAIFHYLRNPLAITRWFLTSWARGTCIFIMHTFIHIFYLNKHWSHQWPFGYVHSSWTYLKESIRFICITVYVVKIVIHVRILISVYNTCTLLWNNIRYVDANLDALDNAISGNENNVIT